MFYTTFIVVYLGRTDLSDVVLHESVDDECPKSSDRGYLLIGHSALVFSHAHLLTSTFIDI